MGHNLSSAFYVAILTGLIAAFGGITGGCIPIGVSAILLGIIGFIFIRNTPQERGIYPDNVSREIYETEYYTADDDGHEKDGGWTTASLLRTKELWLAAVSTGFFQICSVGVMSQLVTRNIRDFGMAVLAIITLSIFAFRSIWAGRSTYYTIAACSAMSIFLFQTVLNVFGSVDLLPLTGVTFPFVSSGGTAMIASWGLLAFLKAADTRQNASIAVSLSDRGLTSEGSDEI